MWNPFSALKNKLKKEPSAPQAAPSAESGATAGLKELEKKGLLGKFFRHWKSPALLRQLGAITRRMNADGVNLKDSAAIQKWLKDHEKEIESGEISQGPAPGEKPHTYVKTGPEVGRNDPCHCGSGKKYKKCHGAGTA